MLEVFVVTDGQTWKAVGLRGQGIPRVSSASFSSLTVLVIANPVASDLVIYSIRDTWSYVT